MKSNNMVTFCIIIPMHNEEANAAKCIDAVICQIKKLKQKVILIVVNDGSSDGTNAILKSKYLEYRGRLILINLRKNHGYGRAIAAGVERASRSKITFALFMDSDLTNNPRDIHKFLDRAAESTDCIKASRYMLGGNVIGVAPARQLISRIANTLCRPIFRLGIHDYTNGFVCVRLSLFNDIKFKENGFAIILEQMYYLKRLKARCVEIPVALTVRKNTRSSFGYQPKVFWNYGKYLLKAMFL